MKRARAALVAALGLFSIAAQALLFRDFLDSLEGSEIAAGAFFGSWLLWVAAGAAAARFACRRRPSLLARFEISILLYIPTFVLQHFLLARARTLLGLESFVLVPYNALLSVSLFANAPTSFLTGFFFTAACAWFPREAALPVAHVYILETLGAFAGGLLVTALLAAGMEPVKVFLFLCVILCFAAWSALAENKSPRPRDLAVRLAMALAALAVANSLGGLWADYENRAQWERLLPAKTYRGAFSTAQGRYLYGEREGDFLVMNAGGVTESFPNLEHASEVAALALAQTPSAQNILIVGANGLAVGGRFAQLPQARKIVWLDPDPAFGAKLLDVLPKKFRAETSRVEVPRSEIREDLETTRDKFDLVILNLPEPTNLVLGRYSTKEFFAIVKKALAPGGTVALRVSGGSNYLGGELVLLGAGALRTLESSFAHVVLKPGEDSFLFASDADSLSDSPEALARRFEAVPGSAALYPVAGILAAYPAGRIAFQMARYRQAAKSAGDAVLVNSDANPKALLYHLLLSLRRAGAATQVSLAAALIAFGAPILLAAILIFAVLRFVYLRKSQRPGLECARTPDVFDLESVIFAAGAVGMAASVVLMFAYQARFGSLFLHVGLVASLFMIGAAAGGRLCEKIMAAGGALPRTLLILTILQIAFLASLAMFAPTASRSMFAFLIFLAGIFSGAYFPVAAKGLHDAGREAADAGGRLEIFDHLGGAAGALLAGLFMLPFFGLRTSVFILAAFAAAVNLVGISAPNRRLAVKVTDAFDAWSRPLGYTLFGIGAFYLVASQILDFASSGEEQALLKSAAQEMTGGAELTEETAALQNGDALTYYAVADAPGVRGGYIFSTARLASGIKGYGGPIALALYIDPGGALKDFRILRSRETPAYLAFLKSWMDGLKGGKLYARRPFGNIDAVSGATMTSTALMKILDASGKIFGSQVLRQAVETSREGQGASNAAWPFFVLAALFLAALILRFRPNPWTRRALLAVSLILSGLYLNHQYSSHHAFSLLALNLPGVALTAGFFMVVILPALVAIFGNVYCGYLCPFGAIQDFLGDLKPKILVADPAKEIWRFGRFVKYILLFAFVIFFSMTRDFSVLGADPLITIFSKVRGAAVIALAAAVLLVSVVFRRFWCRNLCPAGAFLSLINGIGLLKRFLPATRPPACDLGVRNHLELDCLNCDRCRHEKN